MFKTIKSKFIFSAVAAIIITILIPGSYLIWQFGKSFDERTTDLVNNSFEVIHGYIRQAMLASNKNIQGIIESHARYEDIYNIRIIDEAGTIKFSSDSTEIGQKKDQLGAPEGSPGLFKRVLNSSRGPSYSASFPLENEAACQRCHQTGTVIAHLDISTRMTGAEIRFYRDVRYAVLLVIGAIIILILVLYHFFRSQINQPLSQLMRSLEEVGNGNLDSRCDEQRTDEFGKVNRNFNLMVEKLDQQYKEISGLQFEKLKRADKLITLGELAAEMAHEINNPAGIMMARLEYLQLEFSELDQLKKYQTDIALIQKQMNKIAKITDNILRYSKKLPINFRRFNLKEMVTDGLALLQPRLQQKKIQVQKSFDVGKVDIYGDPVQIEQMLINLLNNAIDALPEKGKITVGISKLSQGRTLLFIRDNGHGMKEDISEKIFLPFFTTKSRENGTGLGLYIVKNICKNHGAEIHCESQYGLGTVFEIIFNDTQNQ